jgi:DNA repair photolyase
MGLNKANGNMYEWAKPWNPLGGECPHGCSYCSTNSLKKRYEAVRNKYSGPLKLFFDYPPLTEKTVFVCGQNDFFSEDVPEKWIINILQRCKAKDNTYLFQTKNPARIKQFAPLFPNKSILCTTIETNRWYEQMGNAPVTGNRAMAMHEHYLAGFKIQVTIEPIMDFDLGDMVALIEYCHPTKVNIGADSKHNHLPEPSKDKLLALINELKKFTIIDQKRNLQRLLRRNVRMGFE